MLSWYFIEKHNIILSLIISFTLVVLFIPTIVKISRAKGLVAVPNGRTSHKGNIPSLGGFAMFASILITLLFFADYNTPESYSILLMGITIITAIGLKDDILTIAPSKKIIGQLIAGLLLILFLDVRITNLQGFLGIYQLPLLASILLSLFIIIVITNSVNLIDGVDGLAGSIGVLATAVYGLWFYLNGFIQQALLSATLIGSILAFLIFNFSHGKYKIFMGDSGSLLIGYYLSYLTILFNEYNLAGNISHAVSSAPAFAFGVLIIPLFDTLRIVIVRLVKGHPPFRADKRHIHHRLLALYSSHKKVTLLLALVNIAYIFLTFLLQDLKILILIAIQLGLATLLVTIPLKRLHMKKPQFAKPVDRKSWQRIYYILMHLWPFG